MRINRTDIEGLQLPEGLNNPFYYMATPLHVALREAVCGHIEQNAGLVKELNDPQSGGKMFGAMLVRDRLGEVGFLAAFSGQVDMLAEDDFFVPPVFDYYRPGGYFRREEERIKGFNGLVDDMLREVGETVRALKERASANEETIEAERRRNLRNKEERAEQRLRFGNDAEELQRIEREAQFEKAEFRRLKKRLQAEAEQLEGICREKTQRLQDLQGERSRCSQQLQNWIFENTVVVNSEGYRTPLSSLATGGVNLLSGTGECCAPKLFQYAFENGLQPITVCEFWYGSINGATMRRHKAFYGACQSKCRSVLTYMLKDVDAEYQKLVNAEDRAVEVVFEDEYIRVFNKPPFMQTVKGRDERIKSLQELPEARGLIYCHRLDQDTSGLVVFAKSKEVYGEFQRFFVKEGSEETADGLDKTYMAIVRGSLSAGMRGTVTLRQSGDMLNRPRQIITEDGDLAVTDYEVLREVGCGRYLVMLKPRTGRTHQLRIACASPQGLNAPIVGDPLYGGKMGETGEDRLMLHAKRLQFRLFGREYDIETVADFTKER